MSWVQLHDEIWPVTTDEGELRVYIHASDVGCPRVLWNLEAAHYIRPEHPDNKAKVDRWLDIDLDDLILNLRDWRELSGMEIRADAAWHSTQEFIGPYGHCYNSPRLTLSRTILKNGAENTVEAERARWIAHDFILRLGTRDGWSFPCELDAWLIPEPDYYRDTPETADEVARFAEGPPNFRFITRLTFVSGNVGLTRGASADPIAETRKILRAEIACDVALRPKVSWHVRSDAAREKIVPMPGWRSTVFFLTPPEDAAWAESIARNEREKQNKENAGS